MEPYRFRGHATGLDLEATVGRFPALAARPDAVEALRAALDACGASLVDEARTRIEALVEEWHGLAVQARQRRLGRGSDRLDALPADLAAAARLVPDAPAIVAQALPRGVAGRLIARQPAARLSRDELDSLARVLVRRLEPQVARHLARDAVLDGVVAGLLRQAGATLRDEA